MNERFEVQGGYIGLFEWILDLDRNQSWVTFLPRDIFEKSVETYDDAVVALANTPILAPCYYIVAGPLPLQGAVVTRDRSVAADVWKLGSNSTWFLAETNYDHWEKPLFVIIITCRDIILLETIIYRLMIESHQLINV
jgi:acid ceramidase